MSNVSHGLRNLNIWFSAGGTAWGGGVAWLKKVIGVGLWGWALGGTHSFLTLPLGSLCLVFVAEDVIWASCCDSWLPCLSPLLWAVPLKSEANIHLPLYIAHGHHSNREETHPSHPLPFSALLGPVSFCDLGCHSWIFFLLWLEHAIKYGLTLRCVQMIFLNVL